MNVVTICSAFVLRVLLIIYGCYHDKYMDVAYTDIDYSVFTEAAQHVANGNSPYDKDTYKYTPVLAYLLLPNIYIHVVFGKLLFCSFDILVAFILFQICNKWLRTNRAESYVSILWLFNPLTLTISSRGNAEAIQIVLVLTCLLMILEGHYLAGGLVYGISVHFKLYPIIYLLPIMLHITRYAKCREGNVVSFRSIKRLILTMIHKDFILFVSMSALSFCGIGYVCYAR